MSRPLSRLFTAACIAAASILSISCEGPAGPPGEGFGTLDDPAVMPAVVYTYPPMNSVGPYSDFYVSDCRFSDCPYYSLIQIRFNKFMDVSSVRRAVHIASSSGGITTDTGRIISFGGDVVLVTPVDTDGYYYDPRYEVGEVYTLVVDTTALDVNGNRLASPFTATFVPEPEFRVTAISPEHGSEGVDPTVPIRLYFNADVDSSIIPYLHIVPAIDYSVYFNDRQRDLTIEPAGILPNLTAYNVIIDSGAPGENGHALRHRFSAKFTTEGFGVQAVSPWNGYTGASLSQTVVMYFSSEVDTASFKAAFSVDPPTNGSFQFDFHYYYDYYTITFNPEGGWDELTKYTVRLDTNLRSASGSRLSGPWTSRFTTARFDVSIQVPYSGSSGASRYPYIRVFTNGPIDSTTIAGSISIYPSVPLNVLMEFDPTGFTVVPSELLAPSTHYFFTVDTTLKTWRGVHLTTARGTQFTTAPLE